jgi:hypothetical protein
MQLSVRELHVPDILFLTSHFTDCTIHHHRLIIRFNARQYMNYTHQQCIHVVYFRSTNLLNQGESHRRVSHLWSQRRTCVSCSLSESESSSLFLQPSVRLLLNQSELRRVTEPARTQFIWRCIQHQVLNLLTVPREWGYRASPVVSESIS